jgi:hypothetical protein
MIHEDPHLEDWKAFAIGDNCISIQISENLCIEDAEYRILGPDRQLIVISKVIDRKIEICTPTTKPTFVELKTPKGISVRYVENSGSQSYQSN